MSTSSWFGLVLAGCLSAACWSEAVAQDKPKVQKLTSGRHDASVEKAVDLLKSRQGSTAPATDGAPYDDLTAGVHHTLWLSNRQCVNCHFHLPQASQSSACLRDAQPSGKQVYLGVALARVPAVLRQHVKLTSRMGLLVETVDGGSPADRAGLQQYDVVERIDNQWLVNPEQFRVLMGTFAPGSEVKMTVVHQGESSSLVVQLAERPQWTDPHGAIGERIDERVWSIDELREAVDYNGHVGQTGVALPLSGPVAFLGVQCSAPHRALARQLKLVPDTGLLVEGVPEKSPAQAAGLRRHDLLQKFNDQLLVNTEQLTALVRQCQPGEQVKLTLLREGQSQVVEATLGKRDSESADHATVSAPADGQANRSVQRWIDDLLTSGDVSDELFLRRLHLDLLGTPPTAAELKRFVEDVSPNKRQSAIEELIKQPEAASRLSGQAAARWVDGVHQISLSRLDGQWHLRAESTAGETLFDGPVETEIQREALPAELRTKFRTMQQRLTTAELDGDAATTRASGEEVLRQTISKVDFQMVTLAEAVEQLRVQTGANLVLHAKALEQAGVDLDEEFSLSLADVRLSTVLKTLLALAAGEKPLIYQVQDEVILLTTQNATADMR